jgi:hypothetical protein
MSFMAQIGNTFSFDSLNSQIAIQKFSIAFIMLTLVSRNPLVCSLKTNKIHETLSTTSFDAVSSLPDSTNERNCSIAS